MKQWMNRALALLQASLETPRHELNELDWKAEVSSDKKRLAEHLSAFANYPGGGFLVYGIDASGILHGVNQTGIENILNQLSNIGRQALEPAITIDHAVEEHLSVRLLFIYVAESTVKPVHLRSKSIENAFIRSGGTTRAASRQDIGMLMLHSRTPRWEELHASVVLTEEELDSKLHIEPILKMIQHPMPTTLEEKLNWMASEKLIEKHPVGGGYVTNLGAISAARRIADFQDIKRKAVRVIVYEGLDKSKTRLEKEGTLGYAISFPGILQRIMSQLPQSEVIEKALRTKRTVYPEIALRELVANALIHQDFSITGAGPMVEIFCDRIEISNPGGLLPSKRLDRLIGTQPESRNEQLASAFRRYNICEERGSGLIKAGSAVELYGLPPIEFSSGPNYFKVTLYSPRTFSQMSANERLEACYQHTVLKYYSDSAMTNKTLRERLKMPERQRSMVSALIQEALSLRKIKPANPENKSRKFTEYIPYWA